MIDAVTVEECYSCGGLFLEAGELKTIRDHGVSEEQREAQVQRMINAMPAFQVARMDQAERRTRAEGLRKISRLFTISAWLPGRK
jgi:Zn-finger nucleic acid-binding protein